MSSFNSRQCYKLWFIYIPFCFLFKWLSFFLKPREAAHVHITICLIGSRQHSTGTDKEVCERYLPNRPPLRHLKVLVVWTDGRYILVVRGICVGDGDGPRLGQGERSERHTRAILEGLHPDNAAIEEGHSVPFPSAFLVEQEGRGRLRWNL